MSFGMKTTMSCCGRSPASGAASARPCLSGPAGPGPRDAEHLCLISSFVHLVTRQCLGHNQHCTWAYAWAILEPVLGTAWLPGLHGRRPGTMGEVHGQTN